MHIVRLYGLLQLQHSYIVAEELHGLRDYPAFCQYTAPAVAAPPG
jgi:hypothetical protein